jgi:nucleoside-diphosphate-sugar epimerase
VIATVVGCGWLGLPLAGALVDAGLEVRGTTTRRSRFGAIAAVGAQPARLSLGPGPEGETGVLDGADRVFVCVPPSGPEGEYAAALEALAREAASRGAAHLLVCSSTGVHEGADDHPVVREADVPSLDRAGPRARRLLEAEAAVRDGPLPATVARLAGLWGYGRHPVRSLAGRELDGPDVPVNLVHRDDAIRALLRLSLPEPTLGTYAVVAAEHPPRGAFYRGEAKRLGLPAPRFHDRPKPGKRVSGEALAEAVGVRPRWRPGDPEAP